MQITNVISMQLKNTLPKKLPNELSMEKKLFFWVWLYSNQTLYQAAIDDPSAIPTWPNGFISKRFNTVLAAREYKVIFNGVFVS